MTQRSKEEVQTALRTVRENVSRALEESGRSDTVKLMAVTKTVPPEIVNYAVAEGVTLLGENRVQEFLEKEAQYSPDVSEIHFIGHLQTNKVKYIIGKVSCIESVDSIRLCEEIERQASIHDRIMDILLEVNISNEPSKSGFLKEEVCEAAQAVSAFRHLRLKGLMCIPAKEESHDAFVQMKQLFEELKKTNPEIDTLSMGMSGDYEEAVRCGATVIRLGSAIFGKRNI